jgi:hypothetical protein
MVMLVYQRVRQFKIWEMDGNGPFIDSVPMKTRIFHVKLTEGSNS